MKNEIRRPKTGDRRQSLPLFSLSPFLLFSFSPLSFLHSHLFYLLLALALLLPRIPVVGRFFTIINTALHEFGHAVIALLLEGKVHKIELFGNSAGTATTQSKSKLGSFLVAIAGYPFASTMAYFSFYLIAHQYNTHLIIGLSTLFLVMLFFWVRNSFGIIWTLLFVALNIGLIYLQKPQWIAIAALFYATVIFTESFLSTLILLYHAIRNPGNSGDAANLKKLTHLPAFIWALLFAGYAGWVVYRIYVDFYLTGSIPYV